MGNVVHRATATFDNRNTIRALRGTSLRREQRNERPAQRRRRDAKYQQMIDNAEHEFDARFEANACPREELKNFDILGYVAKGGFGSVYIVKRRADGKKYALKVMPKMKYSRPYHEDMVIHEKKVLYAFRNPFVIRLDFAFQDWKNLYLVMEVAKLGDLFRLADSPNPEKTVKYFAVQMILGIEYIHACNIIHRDIKMSNIFVAKDSYLKIGDFGFAKKIGDRTFTIVGTLPYKAPEQLGQGGYGRAVDVWAMGIIIFLLTFGRHPFIEDEDWTDRRKMDAINNEDIRFPRGVNRNADQNTFLTGCLEKERWNRLGCGLPGLIEMKNHNWFKDVSFNDVYEKKISFIPCIKPVQPKVEAMYEFMPRRKPTIPPTDLSFDGF